MVPGRRVACRSRGARAAGGPRRNARALPATPDAASGGGARSTIGRSPAPDRGQARRSKSVRERHLGDGWSRRGPRPGGPAAWRAAPGSSSSARRAPAGRPATGPRRGSFHRVHLRQIPADRRRNRRRLTHPTVPAASWPGRRCRARDDTSPGAGREMPMRTSRFTESQTVSILKQREAGVPIAEILKPGETH